MKMKKIFAILPCYNEEKNIGELIEEWNNQKEKLLNMGYNLQIIPIDDASKDNTKKVIQEKHRIYNNINLLEHENNKNLKGGLNTGLKFFKDNSNEGDLAVLMDGDNTHSPIYVHEMIEKLKENDCIIASRYCRNSKVIGLAKHRELLSDCARYYYSFMLRVPNVKDYTCGYRLYTHDIINKLFDEFGEEPIKEKSFACMMELLYKIYLIGAKFDEVSFELRYDNKQGESKMKVVKTIMRSLLVSLKFSFKRRKI